MNAGKRGEVLVEDTGRWYTVGETGALTGVTRKTLFYYDRKGLLKPSGRSGNQKHKMYDEEAIGRLKEIQRFRAAGLRIDEVERALGASVEEKKAILEKVYGRLLCEKSEKEEQIRRLLELREALEEENSR